jgi:hypothetical protein
MEDSERIESSNEVGTTVMNPVSHGSVDISMRDTGHSVFGNLSTITTVWNEEQKGCCEKTTHTILTVIRSEEMLVFDLFLSAGVSLYNLCTITSKSPPLFATVSIFAVSFTSFLALQYSVLRIRNGRVVKNLVLVVRNWNHILQLIVVIILYGCLSSDNDTIQSDYTAADGHRVHRHYHCTEVYYGINYTKSIYHFSLMMYALLLGEMTVLVFFQYTGKYFLKTFYVNTIRKAAVKAVVGTSAGVGADSMSGSPSEV